MDLSWILFWVGIGLDFLIVGVLLVLDHIDKKKKEKKGGGRYVHKG